MKGILALSISLFLMCGNALADNLDDNLFGRWRIVAVLGNTPTVSISPAQARKLVGKYVVLNNQNAEFQGEHCVQPQYSDSQEKTFDLFYSGYRSDPDEFSERLPETLRAVRIECNQGVSLGEVYLFKNGSMVFEWLGYFLKAVRTP